MKAFITIISLTVNTLLIGQNHGSKNIRVMVEQEHDHIGGYESASVRVKLFNTQNEVLYAADLFNGTELDETFYYYNASDDLEWERTIFHDNAESGKVEFEYNVEGLLIEEAEYDHQQRPISRITMKYDKAGKMIEKQREARHEGETELYVESNFTYSYDALGRVLKLDGFERGKTDVKAAYQYWYENGGLTQIKEKLDEDGAVVERWIDAYSADDHKISYSHSVYTEAEGKEKMLAEVTYTYTIHGDIQTETIKKEGKVVDEVIFRYDYDNHGNWTTKKEFKGLGEENRKEVTTIQRWIEYYDQDEYVHVPMELDEQFTVELDENQKHRHVSSESHVRINNNANQVVWQVRRNGSDIFQVDYNQYVSGVLIQTKHMNNYQKQNYYTNYNYDATGKLTAEESYSSANVLNGKVLYTYNEKSQLSKMEEIAATEDKALTVNITETYTYNKLGKLFETAQIEFGEEMTIEYIYDSEGRLSVVEQIPGAKGSKTLIEQYSYQDGKMIGRDVTEEKAKEPLENDEFEYNSAGDLIKASFYANGQLREVTLYEYFE